MNQALPSQVCFTLGETTVGTEGTQVQASALPGPASLEWCEDSSDTILGQEPTQGMPVAAQAGPRGGPADVTVYSGFTMAVSHWGKGDTVAVKRKLEWQRAVGGDTQKIKTFQEVAGALQENKTYLLIKPESAFVTVLHSPTKFVAISNATQHLQGWFIGFVGDRTMTKDPTPVLLPK